MWIELIVAVCLYSDPTACRELHFQFAKEQSLNHCAMGAQPYIAGWSAQHPEWRVVRWHCAYPGGREQNI